MSRRQSTHGVYVICIPAYSCLGDSLSRANGMQGVFYRSVSNSRVRQLISCALRHSITEECKTKAKLIPAYVIDHHSVHLYLSIVTIIDPRLPAARTAHCPFIKHINTRKQALGNYKQMSALLRREKKKHPLSSIFNSSGVSFLKNFKTAMSRLIFFKT